MTGKAVMDIAAAMNSANGQKSTPAGARVGCSKGEIAMPNSMGTSTPNRPTAPAAFSCARTPSGARNSAPTMNMKSTRPSMDSEDRPANDSGANNWAWKSGNNAPNTIGPSTMPAAISPTTVGCPA